MKPLLLAIGLLWTLDATAQAPLPTPNAPARAKELAQEARQLSDRAAQEPDPAKADALRKQACEKWEETYQQSKRVEDQLSLGLCYGSRDDYSAAEAALRTFLLLAPATHPSRIKAEQSLAYVQAAQAPASQLPIEFVVKDWVPVELKAAHPWRPVALTGGAVVGAGMVALVVARSVTFLQDPERDREVLIAGERP